jgi:hypothetical protein
MAACGGSGTDQQAAPVPLAKAGGAHVQGAALRAPSEYNDLVQRVYLSYLGRPADLHGLEYWTLAFSNNAMPLDIEAIIQAYPENGVARQLVDAFVNSQESQALYTGNNSAYVNALYLNIFNRNSETAGRAFWADLLARHVASRAQVAMAVLNAAQNEDATVVAKKTEAATYFTNALAKGNNYILAYAGDNINEAARELLGRIAADTDMTAFKLQIDAFIEAMVNTGPGPGVLVTRYSGFNYLQDMDATPAYSANYIQSSTAPGTGTVTYGERPLQVGWTRDNTTGAYTYATPVVSNLQVSFAGSGAETLIQLPQIAMLCTRPTAGSDAVKSTELLIANTAKLVVDPVELSNQTLGIYHEDCVRSNGAANTLSFAFDAAGNAVVTSVRGTTSYTADLVHDILNGQLLIDFTTGQYWTIRAYKFLKADGSYGFVLVQHQGDKKTGLSTGSLGFWTAQ